MRLLACLAMLLALDRPPAGGTACDDGRFLVVSTTAPLIPGGISPTADVVTLAGRRLAIASGCDSARLGRRATRKGLVIKGALRRCDKARVRVVLDDDCRSMQGTIRFGRSGTAVTFSAERSFCGDGRIDRAGGEKCDDDGCGRFAHCAADCSACIPEPTTTTTSTSTTTTSTLPSSDCGNGVRDAGEICDGADLGDAACLHGGSLACFSDCHSLDDSGCFACANGRREGDEACDGQDLGDLTCADFGGTGGQLGCTGACTVSVADCWICGNNAPDPNEECDDGNDVTGDGCTPTCQSECGDGDVGFPREQCDDGNNTSGDGCSAVCLLERWYDGGGGEAYDACMARLSVQGPTPAATVSCVAADATCDLDVAGPGCTFRYYVCFNQAETVGPGSLPPPCAPNGVGSLWLVEPSLSGPLALQPTERGAFVNDVAMVLGRRGQTVTVYGDGGVTVDPPFTHGGYCANGTVTVPAGETRVLALNVGTGGQLPIADHDEMTFACDAD